MRGRGIPLVLVSATAFGTMAVIADRAHANGLDVPMLMLLRFSLAAVILAVLARIRGESFPRGKDLAWLSAMGGILYFGQSLAFFNSLQRIPAAMASLLLYLYPVFVTLLSVAFLGERMTWAKALTLGLALFGTALTIGPVGGGNALGVALAAGSAALYALYVVAGAHYKEKSTPLATTATVMGSGALSYAILAATMGFSQVTPEGFGWAALLALISVIAVGGLIAGLATISPIDASILSALEPIITALMAVVFLGQHLTSMQLIGGTIVLTAVVMLVRQSRQRVEAPGNTTGSMPSP